MRVHNSGSWQRYTFYLVRTRLTDKGAMRPVEILHQDEDAWNATKER
jgi:hypothetical protein